MFFWSGSCFVEIFPFSSIGTSPQDLKYKGEKSKLVIGSNNIIREYVTMNPGTRGGGLITRIGNNCLFMISCHVAHDCFIGNNVIMANNATLAGHVYIDDYAIIGGLSAIHQFVRIGKHAMVGGMSGVEHDVIPYGSVMGDRAFLSGLNIIGLKRRGFKRNEIHDLRTAFRLIFSIEGTITERLIDAGKMYKKNKVLKSFDKLLSNTKKNGSPALLPEIEKKLKFKVINLNVGDVVIFSNTCPHRSKKNKSNFDRKTLYYTYTPLKYGSMYEKYFYDKKNSKNKTNKSFSGET